MRRLLVASAVAVASQFAAASDVKLPPPVIVDVIATDARGRPVENLKPADFELKDDGTVQAIEEVRLVKPEPAADGGDRLVQIRSDLEERTEASRANVRLFAIYLDEFHVSGANTPRVRAALTRFIDDSLAPSDMVVFMRPLDSLLTIRMTRDRDRMRQQVEDFQGRKGEYEPRTAYERTYFAGTPARIEQLRAQVTASALNALASHLGSLNKEARKTLVVVSEGLPPVERRRGLESLPTVETVIRAANRANVAIYAIDPRTQVDDAPAALSAGALQMLAAATEGQWFGSAEDLTEGMRRVTADASSYYLLLYRPVAQKRDGRFHDLQVTVKRRGIAVRARQGYWAALPADEGDLAALLTPKASVPTDPPRRISPLIRPWFGASRGVDGRTRLVFVWEPATRVPGDRSRSIPSRIVLTALGADGTALFEGPVLPVGPLQLDSADEAQARAVFEAPPGVLRLRMSIEDEAAEKIDSDVREIRVRDLSAPVVLGTPEVLRARTARDVRLLDNDPEAVPVAAREFSRAERLMIRVPAYAPAGVPLTVTAKLLSRGGQPMRDLPVRTDGVPATMPQIDVPLASLAAGQYLIEVVAKSPAGDAKDLLEFRVTN